EASRRLLQPFLDGDLPQPEGISMPTIQLDQVRNLEGLGLYRQAMTLLESILDASAPIEPAVRARALVRLSHIAFLRGDPEEARRRRDEAFDLASAVGEPALVASVHSLTGLLIKAFGDTEAAAREHEASIAIHGRSGNQIGVAMELTNLAWCWVRRDPDRA